VGGFGFGLMRILRWLVQGFRLAGVMRSCNAGMPQCWNAKMPKYRNVGMSGCRDVGMLGCWDAVPLVRIPTCSLLLVIVRYCSTYSGSIIDIVLFPVDIDTTDFRLVIHC